LTELATATVSDAKLTLGKLVVVKVVIREVQSINSYLVLIPARAGTGTTVGTGYSFPRNKLMANGALSWWLEHAETGGR
jgi:hypothetical protein